MNYQFKDKTWTMDELKKYENYPLTLNEVKPLIKIVAYACIIPFILFIVIVTFFTTTSQE